MNNVTKKIEINKETALNYIHEGIGARLVKTFKSTGVQHVQFPKRIILREVLTYYRSQVEVVYAEANQIVHSNNLEKNIKTD